jgi:hypothetical protein
VADVWGLTVAKSCQPLLYNIKYVAKVATKCFKLFYFCIILSFFLGEIAKSFVPLQPQILKGLKNNNLA